MKTKFTCLFFLLILTLTSSCYTTRAKQLDAIVDSTIDGEEYVEKTIHMFLWKADRTWIENTCASGAMSEVEFESNFLFSLANVASLGLWKPVKVRYKCSKN